MNPSPYLNFGLQMKSSNIPKITLALVVLWFLILTSIAAQPLNSIPKANSEIKSQIANARYIYQNHHKESINLDGSIDILEKIIDQDPHNLEAHLLLSRVYLTYGHTEATNKDQKISLFKNGMEIGKKATELAPDNPDAHFIYVANMASLGKEKGILKSLFIVRKIRNEVELILKLDPNHVEGTAMNGVLFYSLPAFMGGDIYISQVYLRRAIMLDPHLTTTKIYLAKNLMKQEKYDEAKKTLQEVINEKKPTLYSDWYFNRETARKMIERIEKKQSRSARSYISRVEAW